MLVSFSFNGKGSVSQTFQATTMLPKYSVDKHDESTFSVASVSRQILYLLDPMHLSNWLRVTKEVSFWSSKTAKNSDSTFHLIAVFSTCGRGPL